MDIAVAYTVDKDKDAKYPAKNFLNVVPERISRKGYDTLVLQGGCNEISNLNVKSKFTAEDVKIWEDKIRISRTKLFNLAEDSLKKEKNLKNVIIFQDMIQKRWIPVKLKPS